MSTAEQNDLQMSNPALPFTAVAAIGSRRSSRDIGTINPPIHRASTIVHPNVAALETARVLRSEPGHALYGRDGLPIHDELESAISAISGGFRTCLLSSGLAAINVALLAFARPGDHMIMLQSVYSPTRRFAEKFLAQLGVSVEFVSASAKIDAHLRKNTKAVFLEAPSSNCFEIPDVPAIANITRSQRIPLILDNSWSAGILFNAFKHGVDVSVQSLSKYVGGHSDLIGGAVTANEAAWPIIQEMGALYASPLAPDDAYLAMRGIRTLPTRLQRHESNAYEVIAWLRSRPEVARVLSPAMFDHPGHAIWKRDFSGHSGLFGVAFSSNFPVTSFVESLSLFRIGQGWGGFESLVLPITLTNSSLPETVACLPAIRLHIGLEDPKDIIADLEAAFFMVGS